MKMVDVEKAVPMTCRMVRTIEVRRPVKRSSSCCHFSFVVTLFLIAALTYFTVSTNNEANDFLAGNFFSPSELQVQNYNCLERQSNRIMEQVNRNRADLITFGTLGYVLKSWGSPSSGLYFFFHDEFLFASIF